MHFMQKLSNTSRNGLVFITYSFSILILVSFTVIDYNNNILFD